MNEDLAGIIYEISPAGDPPWMPPIWRGARIRMRQRGGSMRARRRRVAKPLQFTPRDSLRKEFQWHLEELKPLWQWTS